MAESLSALSPSLAGKLRALSAPERELLGEVFAFAAAHGALEEGPLARTAGASFNPRPSRVAQIAMPAGGVPELARLAAAALSCMSTWTGEAARFPGAEIARDVIRARETPAGSAPAFSSAAARDIFLAHRLDELRHVHLLPAALAAEQYQRLKAEAPLWRAGGESPLLPLLDAALGRAAQSAGGAAA